jgi:flagellar motor protein MotB
MAVARSECVQCSSVRFAQLLSAERQADLLQAREREVLRSAEQAGNARQAADAAQLRADSLEAQLADLKVKKTERGLVLTLGDVLSTRVNRR